MKLIFKTATILALTATTAMSQGVDANSESTSGSYSQTNTVFEGAKISNNTPGLGSVGSNSTAPCVVANGVMIAGPGAGVGFSNGRINRKCEVRIEGGVVNDVLNMPHGPARTATILHLCTNDADLRATFAAMGVCKVSTAPQKSTNSHSSNRRDTTVGR
jgi:hypothetical protein